jgi:translocator protein
MITIPTWLIIGAIAFGVAFLSIRLQNTTDIRWFNRQRRPPWLTFEALIPLIWTFILCCGVASASLAWQASRHWGLMGAYLALELMIMSYTPVMSKCRRLSVGTWIGGIGFGFGCLLALWVQTIDWGAFWLLVPYLLWSPIGTFVTWQMDRLNPAPEN